MKPESILAVFKTARLATYAIMLVVFFAAAEIVLAALKVMHIGPGGFLKHSPAIAFIVILFFVAGWLALTVCTLIALACRCPRCNRPFFHKAGMFPRYTCRSCGVDITKLRPNKPNKGDAAQ